jgi:midasin (ATPase involved in ribosome maturation)
MRHSLNAALKKSLEKDILDEWKHLSDRMERLESQLKAGHASLAFSFIEGALVSTMIRF